jgi:hypothetical protein
MKKYRPKKCKVCSVQFTPQYSSLQVVCSPKCAVKFNSKKEVNKRVKEMRKESTKLSTLEAAAKLVFQKWVRMRDANEACISCGVTQATQWDGSHYFKAEIFSGVIFDEDNVHKSCSYCNCHLDGNLANYRIGLVKKIGEERIKALEERANLTRQYKYTREQLLEITASYKTKIKEITASNNVGTNIYEVRNIQKLKS